MLLNHAANCSCQLGCPFSSRLTIAHPVIQRRAALHHVRGGVYLNFMKGEEAGQRARDAYLPETFLRLGELKAKYDPDNQFRFSYQLR